ncbi:MAG: redoxin domain-containing protein [Guyparkeria sp.]
MLVAGLLALGGTVMAESASASPRDTPVVLEKEDVHGEPRNLADLRGDIVFINVWASWCPSCVQELPELQAFHEAHRDEGVHVWRSGGWRCTCSATPSVCPSSSGNMA